MATAHRRQLGSRYSSTRKPTRQPTRGKQLHACCSRRTEQRRCIGVCARPTYTDEEEVEALTEYISQGVITRASGISKDQVRSEISRWREAGAIMAANLGFEEELDAVQKQRIYQYYLPIFFWSLSQLEKHQACGGTKPVVIGMSAPQGCGKTTIVTELQKLYEEGSIRCASVSIDDFYLSNADQKAVSKGNPDNRLVQGRGNAGTHDLQLGGDTLQRLRKLGEGESMAVPRYDKSAYGGEGDTADKENWPLVTGPLDIVLFEGWMLGFCPVGAEKAKQAEDAMAQVDEYLQQYESQWDSHVHSWLVIKVADAKWVHKWRLEAEQKMKAAGKEGMSDEGVKDFVNRYLPAYDTYLPGLYEEGPTTCQKDRTLFIEVDENRQLIDAEAR